MFLIRKDPFTRYVAGLLWGPQNKNEFADTGLVTTGPVLRGAVARNRSSLVLLTFMIAWRLGRRPQRSEGSGPGFYSLLLLNLNNR
jgi:hypothetical protein